MPEPPTVSSPDPASVSTGIDETFVIVIGAEAVAPEVVADGSRPTPEWSQLTAVPIMPSPLASNPRR
jgi:hypothetical protein